MTLKLDNIVLADTENTQFSYLVTTNPNPLQINSTGSITVVIYRAAPPAIQCTQLQFSVVIGTSDIDLTNSANISTTCPTGWSLSSGGAGIFIFQPSGGSAMIGPDGLTFEFSNIAVNGQVGGTLLKIIETVTLNNHSQTNSTSFTLSKFPQAFNLESFTAQPTSIAPGGTVTLSWSGSSSDSNTTYVYSLSYGSANVSNLQPVATYPLYGLQASTEFTLNVEAGGSALCQKQVYVTVEQPTIIQFGTVSSSDFITEGSTIEFCWQTENVDHCALSLNGTPISGATSLPANSTAYSFTLSAVTGELQFTLTAFPGKRNNGGIVSSTFINVFKLSSLLLPAGGLNINMSSDGSYLATSMMSAFIISTAENQLIKTIDSGSDLNSPTLNSDGTQLYCVDYADPGEVDSFALSGQLLNQSLGNYASIVKGAAQGSMIVAAVCPKQSQGYTQVSSLAVLDPSNLSQVKSVDFQQTFDFKLMTANPQGDLILICTGSGIYSYQLETNTLSSTPVIPGLVPLIAAFSADGKHYFVADLDPEISVVDAADNQVIGKIPLPAPLRFAGPYSPATSATMVAAPDGINFFAVLNNYTIAWIRLDSMQVIECFQVGTHPQTLAMHPAGTALYVLDTLGGIPTTLWTVEISLPT
ncbi:MAG: hypothetical protein KME07_05600 [Pegethrix bostrychoides GSE-TBD4-15B]|jgi:hypothetical protein|uniref:Uncharacterized protein n=1 Tax=Pegethrix bostrychoides GSE-TBD4-15B TaxID=2839662 RepID=A0A951P8T1_9CYAN|nr:hypothetical protein [Pegethrix bostrychoides GSE-TBD4-15B]